VIWWRLATGYPRYASSLGEYINQPQLLELIRRFLHDQLAPDAEQPGSDILLSDCPTFSSRITVFHSAVATFYAPSDLSGIGGMHRQRIRSTPNWRGEYARRDCIFATRDAGQPGMRGLHALRVLLFFSFKVRGVLYPCALVEWFDVVGDEVCDETGMWMVEPELGIHGNRVTSVIHLDSVVRGAHFIPVFGDEFLPRHFHFSMSLDAFRAYYINKFIDHHSNLIAF
jgi:hypothetical protein